MQLYALNSFRPGGQKGKTVSRGDAFEIDDHTGEQLIAGGLATRDKKAVKEYENKMQAEFANKGLPVESETPEARSQGNAGPAKTSESPEHRSQGVAGPSKKKFVPTSGLPGREITS